MEFNSPKNFKNGKYVFGQWRWKDFILMVSSIIFSVFVLVAYLSSTKKPQLFMIPLIFVPALIISVLTIPTAYYVCVREWINMKIDDSMRHKKYMSLPGKGGEWDE